jgi:hypothetical protein
LNPSTEYTYRVVAYYETTTSPPSNEVTQTTDDPVDVSDDHQLQIPDKFALEQNYPNPFNPLTTINYQLPKTTKVIIKIYNIHGQLVTTLVNKLQPAGYYRIGWQPEEIVSGVYFYQLKTENYLETKKMIYQK